MLLLKKYRVGYIKKEKKEYLNIMLDERDYCDINVNHDVELFGE